MGCSIGAEAQRRTAKGGFLASRGMLEGEARRQGKKVGDGRCGPGARGEAVPVQIGPSKDAPGTAGPNWAGPRRTAPPRRPTPQRGRQPPAPAPPRAHLSPPPPALDGSRQAFATFADSGRTIPSRLPAWTGRRAKDGTRRAYPLSAKRPPHQSGATPSAASRLPAPTARAWRADRHRGASPLGGARQPVLDGEGASEARRL